MNNNFLTTIFNETEKIFRRRRTIVFVIATLVISLVILLAIVLLQNKIGVFAITAGQFPYFILNLFAGILLPLFIFAITADIFAGEIQDKTLKLVLTRPITRIGIYFAKVISVILFTVVILAVLLLFSIFASFFLDGIQSLISQLPQILISYLVTIIPMTLVAILGVFISQFFKNSGTALTMAIFIFLGIKALVLVFPSIAQLLPFSYNDWYLYWINGTIGITKLVYSFAVMLSYMLIFSAVGSYFFDKQNI